MKKLIVVALLGAGLVQAVEPIKFQHGGVFVNPETGRTVPMPETAGMSLSERVLKPTDIAIPHHRTGMGKLPLVSHIALDTRGSGVVQSGETCDLLLTGSEHGVISCGTRRTFGPGEYVTVVGSPTGTPPNIQYGDRYIGSHVDNAGSKPGAGRRTIYLLPEHAVKAVRPVELGTEF